MTDLLTTVTSAPSAFLKPNALSGTAPGLLLDQKDGMIIAACIMLIWLCRKRALQAK